MISGWVWGLKPAACEVGSYCEKPPKNLAAKRYFPNKAASFYLKFSFLKALPPTSGCVRAGCCCCCCCDWFVTRVCCCTAQVGGSLPTRRANAAGFPVPFSRGRTENTRIWWRTSHPSGKVCAALIFSLLSSFSSLCFYFLSQFAEQWVRQDYELGDHCGKWETLDSVWVELTLAFWYYLPGINSVRSMMAGLKGLFSC